jgi:hypothetical protein
MRNYPSHSVSSARIVHKETKKARCTQLRRKQHVFTCLKEHTRIIISRSAICHINKTAKFEKPTPSMPPIIAIVVLQCLLYVEIFTDLIKAGEIAVRGLM